MNSLNNCKLIQYNFAKKIFLSESLTSHGVLDKNNVIAMRIIRSTYSRIDINVFRLRSPYKIFERSLKTIMQLKVGGKLNWQKNTLPIHLVLSEPFLLIKGSFPPLNHSRNVYQYGYIFQFK